jgi:hypothetical protein
MDVCRFKCCVFSVRGLCNGPISYPEKSYRLCVCFFLSLSVIRCSNNTLHLKCLGRLKGKKVSVGKHEKVFYRIKYSICRLPVSAIQKNDFVRCTEFETGPSVLNHASCSGEAYRRSSTLYRMVWTKQANLIFCEYSFCSWHPPRMTIKYFSTLNLLTPLL